MDEIVGYIERITYQNGENGYTVAKIQLPKQRDLTCIVGTMPGLQPGETVRCKGQWKNHLVHGRQFEVDSWSSEAPADVHAIEKYLGSGLIRGIGPVFAKKIVDTFGEKTLEVIDTEAEKLLKVPGLGKKKLGSISSCWQEQKQIRRVMLFLQKHGLTPTFAQKIFKTYGNESVEKIEENPYRLSKEMFGVGFKMADALVEKMGIEKEAKERIDAGIEFVFDELSGEGHVCYPEEKFLERAASILEVSQELIETRIEVLVYEESLMKETLVFENRPLPHLWKRRFYLSEKGIAKEVLRLKTKRSSIRSVDVEKALTWVQKRLHIELADDQKKAVAAAMEEKIQIITGGPGTGKSTITNAILTITEKLTDKILLAAPTGRAAKRMSEITGKKAKTIHALLEVDFSKGGFKKNRDHPLECDLIIIDEASMIDTSLMYSLLRAIPSNARVIFVGDIDQLPSVGPGNVLKDFILSETVTVNGLTEIFRQANHSKIVVNAHRMNRGQMPELKHESQSDFYFIEEENPDEIAKTILTLVANRIPRKWGFHPLTDIQVLAPMKKGVIGIANLNALMQKTLNPGKDPIWRNGKSFCLGDKVMQLRNNYKKEVFNGDIGIITHINTSESTLTVRYDKDVEYEFTDLDEVDLAYAVSIHKYQGSECPCVVIPVHTTHFKLLMRNLLYTGVTRGKKLVILIGSKRAIAIAVHNEEVLLRHTGLREALSDCVGEKSKLPF